MTPNIYYTLMPEVQAIDNYHSALHNAKDEEDAKGIANELALACLEVLDILSEAGLEIYDD